MTSEKRKSDDPLGPQDAEDPGAADTVPYADSDDPLIPADESAVSDCALPPLEQMRDQMMRALAEAENTRRRAAREREDVRKYALSAFSRDLLSVADNLRRALESVPAEMSSSEPRISALLTGIEATERELIKTLEKNGVRKLNPLGETFDPNFHEVMFETPIPGKPGGTVIQVVETGYILHDRLLRPARVGISRAVDQPAGDGPPPPHSIDTKA